jgi:methyl-accepting chemotaxis protein
MRPFIANGGVVVSLSTELNFPSQRTTSSNSFSITQKCSWQRLTRFKAPSRFWFEPFAKALEAGTKVSVTKENVDAISLLAKEFWLEDLVSQCSDLQPVSVPEFVTALSERISQLEHQMSSQALFASMVDQISSHSHSIAALKESMTDHARQLESLISTIETNSDTRQREMRSLISHFPYLIGVIQRFVANAQKLSSP